MKNKISISLLIICLSIFACGKGQKGDNSATRNNTERDRANAIGVQGTELEENSNSSKTTDRDRTDIKKDTTNSDSIKH